MTDFFDWLTATDSGLAADRLASFYRLSHEEMRRTTEALAPAYSIALQKAMNDPFAWSELWRRFVPLMNDSRVDVGSGLSETLFGSQGLSSAVARQASVACGIAPDVVEKLMQNLSLMTVQAMLGMMMANMARNQPAGLLEGDYPGAIAEMMRRGANAVEAMGRPSDQRRPQPGGLFASDTLEKIFAGTLKGGLPWLPPTAGARPPAPAPRRETTIAPSLESFDPFLPLTAMLDGFSRGLSTEESAGPKAAAPAEARKTPDPAPAAKPAEDETGEGAPPILEAMARDGRRMQEDYAREMMALFKRYQDGFAGKAS
ncbi:hypothetical protein [Aurantimonas sp. Leaf443]|uniref:hypothetical protein n=1 Tax=Aurantimonas sp. Leaf443 TaxID=1736378 RepID=UPI0006FF8B57|nr:hypothetical protein [Aurantimonas sp. Leaf443]KQT87943.1 hypothetical protein ASG48_00295 [Aurantimonas sp. Leaf443]